MNKFREKANATVVKDRLYWKTILDIASSEMCYMIKTSVPMISVTNAPTQSIIKLMGFIRIILCVYSRFPHSFIQNPKAVITILVLKDEFVQF